MEAFLVGHCGKSVKEAMAVTAEEYGYLLRGYNEDRQERYDIARWISFNFMQISPYVKNKPRTLHDFAPFPWDKPRKVKPSRVTPEENKELNRILDQYIAQKKNRNEQIG